VEQNIEQQIQESGFAEAYPVYLTQLVLQTDSLKELSGDDYALKAYSVKAVEGNIAGQNMMIGSSINSVKASIKNFKVNANIQKGLQKLGGDGVRCAVAVSFDVQLTAANGDTILISLAADFTEELKVGINASGNAVWRQWKIFYYLYDYNMSSDIDVYEYTGIHFNAVVTTKNGTIDISDKIQELLNNSDSKQVNQGVKNFIELYQNMMKNNVDWIDIFDGNLATIDFYVFEGFIEVKTTFDFVVGGQINVALGCDYEYKAGNRYSFRVDVLHRNAESSTSKLITEENSFQLYVLGKLGLRAGIRLSIAVGIISVNLDSMAITANTGIYYRIGGFFYYQYGPSGSSFSGSCNLGIGSYLNIAFKAQLLNGTQSLLLMF
jgi:hypothetical protein